MQNLEDIKEAYYRSYSFPHASEYERFPFKIESKQTFPCLFGSIYGSYLVVIYYLYTGDFMKLIPSQLRITLITYPSHFNCEYIAIHLLVISIK